MIAKLALLALVGAVSQRQPAPGTPPLLDEGELQAAGLVKYWEAHLPLAPGDNIEHGYLVDEALYVTTDLGNAFALKADVGLLRWAVNLTEPDYKIFAPTHVRRADGAGPVVIPTTTATFVYDRFSGALLERFTPEFATGSPAVAYDHNLFMGSTGGRFYALLFNHPRLERPIKRWDVLVRGPITAAPVLYDRNNLLIASHGGVVVSCQAENKALNWSYETGGAILGDPVVDDTGAYVASLDRSVYKLNKSTGWLLWRVRFPAPLEQGPVVAGGAVYQLCAGQGLTALDAATGKTRWRHAEGLTLAAQSPAGDVIFTSKKSVDVVDHDSGKVRASISAPAVLKPVVNTTTSAVYLLGAGGRVLALQLDSAPYLRRQQIMAARRDLNQPPGDRSNLIKAPPPVMEEIDPLEDDPLRSRRDINPQPDRP